MTYTTSAFGEEALSVADQLILAWVRSWDGIVMEAPEHGYLPAAKALIEYGKALRSRFEQPIRLLDPHFEEQ